MDLFDNEATRMMNELRNLSEKYQNYKRAMPSKINFRDVQNDMERELASKVYNRVSWIIGIGFVVFFLFGIIGIVQDAIFGGIMSFVGAVFLLYFFLSAVLSKHKVAYGTAVWKHYRLHDSSGRGSRMYFISAIFEQPEKIIVRDLQVSRADYDMISEGTPVMIIKKGNIYQACLYNTPQYYYGDYQKFGN